MENEIEKKLKELADKIKFGEFTVNYVVSRGKIVKAIIKETKEVVLFQ